MTKTGSFEVVQDIFSRHFFHSLRKQRGLVNTFFHHVETCAENDELCETFFNEN